MPSKKEQYDALDRVIEEHIHEPGALMPVLQGAQEIGEGASDKIGSGV